MDVKAKTISKADFGLASALAAARPADVLRVVLTLRPSSAAPAVNKTATVQFGARSDYRRSLIAAREQKMTQTVGPTIAKLKAMNLAPHGGRVNPVVVVEGKADDILRALSLRGVAKAVLDRESMISLA